MMRVGLGLGGGVADAGQQVGAFGAHPGQGAGLVGQVRCGRGRCGGRWQSWAGVAGEVVVGCLGGVLVVVQELFDGLVAVAGGVVAGGEGAGVFADEVVEAVAAGGGFVDEVVGVQGVQVLAGLAEGDAGQGGGGVGVDVDAGMQAQAAEQALPVCGQVLVRHLERGSDRWVPGAVSGGEFGEPVLGGGEVGGEGGDVPAGVVGQAAGEQGDGQRQIPAQPGQLGDGAGVGAVLGAAGQAEEQLDGLVRGQGVQRQWLCAVQGDQAAAAGDQHQAPGRPGQQRSDLGVPGGVVQHQQYLLAGQAAAPPLRPRLHPCRDLAGGHARAGQQVSEHLTRVGRLLAGRVGVQIDEQLPVGKGVGEQVRGAGHQRGLAHPRHAVHGMDRDHAGRSRGGGDQPP